MSSENCNDNSPPRTPVPLKNPSKWVLSPPRMQRAYEDRESDGCQEYLDNEQEREEGRNTNYPGSIILPSSPIMEMTPIPQEESIADTSHHLNRSRSNRCSKRRSYSLDESMPIPRILLRPRVTKKNQEHFSSCTRTRQRGQHFRSHTFDVSDRTDIFSSLFDRVSSPPNDPSFTMAYLNQALPTASTFSPLGKCSMDSPLTTPGVARPIPHHFTPAGAPHNLTSTPLSPATTIYGVGTICSSSTSAFETAPSTIAKSRANSVRTSSPHSDQEAGGSLEDFCESSLSNEILHNYKNLATTTNFGASIPGNNFGFPFDGKNRVDRCTLPFDEVCVSGIPVMKSESKFGAFNSPVSTGSDLHLEQMPSYFCDSDEASLFETEGLQTQHIISRSLLSPHPRVKDRIKTP